MPDDIESLIRDLASDDWKVVEHAKVILARRVGMPAISRLSALVLSRDTAHGLRSRAADALRQIDRVRVGTLALAIVQDRTESLEVRRSMAHYLNEHAGQILCHAPQGLAR